jgi:hypothetical protein
MTADAKIDAVAYGLSLVHEDLRAFRGEMGERLGSIEIGLDRHGELLGSISDRIERQEARLERHGEMLQEILRRLPGGPA